jgi:GTP-binding protein YchF
VASLEVGIVGLPNAGKTSVFNALTGAGAEVTGYAATRTSANVGVAAVPDERIDRLAEAVSSRERIPATVGFSDVAGLVRGAGASAGLGGEFLGHLRATDALAHVVRTFRDESVFHPDGSVDPLRDAETVDLELLLADQSVLERRRERVAKAARVGEKGARDEMAVLDALAAHLDAGEPARTFAGELPGELDLLTSKPVVYVANVGEEGDAEDVAALAAYAAERGSEVVPVAARFEAELAEIDDPEERDAFLRDLGLKEPGMPRLARACYRVLGLISFFTAGPKETRAWTIRRGATAVEAAGKIHSDIARGFIRAEVIPWEELVALGGSSAEARKRGVERIEGRDYVVQDGDVLNIRFNV